MPRACAICGKTAAYGYNVSHSKVHTHRRFDANLHPAVIDGAGILLVGLVAGAWVDRLRRRPLLIWDDFLRAALLLSIPVAYAVGGLRIEQLYVVMFLESCLGALFDAAYPAYVPTLIGRDR